MLLSERYRELFTALQERLELVRICDIPAQRTCYREQAEHLQRKCGDVAHCLALLGDVHIEELAAEHIAVVERTRCSGMHVWRNGLRLVRPDLFQQ